MVNVALYVKLEAKPGKEAEVEAFLRSGLTIVEEEPATIAWFAIKMGIQPSAFSTLFRTKPVARRIFPDRSPPH